MAGETPSLTGEYIGETNRVLECTQAHPPRNQHQKGPIWLWVAGEVTESGLRAKQATLFSTRPLPHRQHQNAAIRVDSPHLIPKAPPLTMLQVCQEIRPKWRNRSNFKIQLSDKQIANLSDAEFKTLVIKMLTEMVEYGHKIEEKVKAMQSEIKENVQGTNSDRKETGT